MEKPNSFVLLTVLVLVCSLCIAEAYPTWNRNKRVSDQRLAELETLLALARLKGRLPNVQMGYGFIDPNKIGRKKRDVDNQLVLDDYRNVSADGEDKEESSNER